jgi:ChrR Cupin-like domain
MLFAREDTYAAFMLDHAAGNHPESLALAGDLHLLMSAEAARTAFAWSIIGGALLPAEDGDLGGWRGEPKHRRHNIERSATGARGILEAASQPLRWKRGLLGIPYFPIGVAGGRLMKLDPGQSVPQHGHSATEATVVILGTLKDAFGDYHLGGLMLGEPGMQHKPIADGDVACICYVAEPPRFAWRLQ